MTEAPTASPAGKPPRGRSPNYPGISLPAAIEKARVVYDYGQQHPVPRVTITEKWGFKNPDSGTAAVTYAALKKFGLLEDEGSGKDRQGRITDLGVEVLVPNANQQAAIQRAALLPPIYSEWFKKYQGGLPPEATLQFEYVARGPFTQNGFTDFLREYRETIAFAKLDGSVSVPETELPPDGDSDQDEDQDQDEKPDGGNKGVRRRNQVSNSTLTYAVPVAIGTEVAIEGPFPLTEAQWAQFMAVLEVLKPGLVGEPNSED